MKELNSAPVSGAKPTLLLVIKFSLVGGAQLHVLQLVRYFSERYSVHLCVGELGYIADEASKLGVPTHHLPELGGSPTLLGLWKMNSALKGLVTKIAPDLVHLHSPLAGVVGRYVCWRAGVACVTSIHSWNFVPGMPLARRMSSWLLEFFVAKLGQRIITVSDYDFDIGRRYLVARARQMVAVHNGIPDTQHQKTWSSNSGVPVVIMVARFDLRKCQHELINALASIAIPWKLVFAGEGPTQAACKQQVADLGLEKQVSFLGNRADVPELLAAADVCVLATEVEGLPLALIEAMRAGLPVVANSVGGIPELISDAANGWLIPVNNEQLLAEKLNLLLKSADLRQEQGERSRMLYEQQFTEQEMLSKIAHQYCLLTKEKFSKGITY